MILTFLKNLSEICRIVHRLFYIKWSWNLASYVFKYATNSGLMFATIIEQSISITQSPFNPKLTLSSVFGQNIHNIFLVCDRVKVHHFPCSWQSKGTNKYLKKCICQSLNTIDVLDIILKNSDQCFHSIRWIHRPNYQE